jgi:hypothetical protein
LLAISKKSLADAPVRLQRILLQLSRYNYRFVFKPGKTHYLPDYLSRTYLPAEIEDTIAMIAESEMIAQVENETRKELQLICSEATRKLLNSAAAADPTYQSLKRIIQDGWPENVENVPTDIVPYFTYRDELSTVDDLIFKGNRIVVPESARETIMQRLYTRVTWESTHCYAVVEIQYFSQELLKQSRIWQKTAMFVNSIKLTLLENRF